MKRQAKADLYVAAVFIFLMGVVIVTGASASIQAQKLGLQPGAVAPASAAAAHSKTPAAGEATSAAPGEIVVTRPGGTTLAFTSGAAVTYEITSLSRELARFEVAVGKDLARREFRAPRTSNVVRTAKRRLSGPATTSAISLRRQLRTLEGALLSDIARGAFRAHHTRKLVVGAVVITPVQPAAEATETVAIADDLWELEMAMEKDIHAHEFKARETHFVIDGRRW